MPPGDHVLDTNVLLVASASDPDSPFKDSAHVPLAEQRAVFEWLREFRRDRSRHLVLAARLPEPLQTEVKDRSDRKFVAVVLADERESSLVNACDTDWYDCEAALMQAGVNVEQIIDGWCRAKHAEKHGK